jgi:sec-independent protein translocase protein TatC
MPIGPKRMPFFSHLDELRRRLAWIVLVVGGGGIALYYWGWDIYEFLMRPVVAGLGDVPLPDPFMATSPFELFAMRFKVALFAAAVATAPFWIYHVMAFFLPALKPKERKWFIPVLLSMIVFFVMGVVFCWLWVLEPGFGWLLAQCGDTVTMLPKASEFFRGVTLFLLGFGLGFQTPVIVFGLIVLGIVPYEKLRENWRTAYVVIMVVASVATPDWSWVTMLSLFGAMLALYEGSLFVARIALRRRIAAQAAQEL